MIHSYKNESNGGGADNYLPARTKRQIKPHLGNTEMYSIDFEGILFEMEIYSLRCEGIFFGTEKLRIKFTWKHNPLDFRQALRFYFRQKREVMSSNSPVSFCR